MYIQTCKHKQSKYIQLIPLNTKNVMTTLFSLTFFTIMEISMSTKANQPNKTIDEIFFILKSIYIKQIEIYITSKTLIQNNRCIQS